jgi:alpha-tubulin suppressor-like RCC1 family protein/tRNA A-37 threonylcarbamoyl transferase component Bud32
MDMMLPDSLAQTPLNPPPDLVGGAPFSDSYELIREIGRGGMAIVYLMRERETGIERAVKVIHTKHLDDEEALARFDREARLVAQLQHPNIVATHSVRWIEAVGFGLVMDHVPGRTLKEMLRDGPKIGFDQATCILSDIAAALSFAHERGIVHRDVKPENIFIDESSGRALLADFGIARSVSKDTQQLTLAGVAIGTPTYMAPEQIDGSIVDARSDLYSLGLVGWEILTGRRPWDGETLYNVIYHQKHDQLAAIDALRPETPPRLVAAIERLLEKSPADRWQSAEQFRNALTSDAPIARKREFAAPAPDETIAMTISPARQVRSRIRRIAPFAAIGAALVSATLLFAWPVSDWVPLISGGNNAVTHIAPKVKRAPVAAVPHSPVSHYGVLDSAGAGIIPAVGAAQPATDPSATGVDSGANAAAAPGDSSANSSAKSDAKSGAKPGANSAANAATSSRAAPKGAAAASVAAESAQANLPATMPAPAAPAPLMVVASGRSTIAAGGAHTCIIALAGSTYCWGANSAGQLGSGASQGASPAPTAVTGGMHFSSISAGLSHTCALARGTVYCWGNNDHGQLGDGTHASHDTPMRAALARSLTSVVAGSGFSCGLASDGTAYCWGAGTRGQIGDGTANERITPVKVSTTVSFAMLAAGWNHVCGLTGSGRAYCWGANDSGQIGDGTITDRSTPTAVRSDLRFTTLSAGSAHTCGTTSSGAAYCWGDNQYGQLGDGTHGTHFTPTEVSGNARFVALSAGSVHTCGLTRSGDAWCWGRNTYGQLGDGSTVTRTIPVPVSGGHAFTTVNSFGSHTCGTTASGDLFCWGYNLDGQLGDGTREHRLRPTYIEKPA